MTQSDGDWSESEIILCDQSDKARDKEYEFPLFFTNCDEQGRERNSKLGMGVLGLYKPFHNSLQKHKDYRVGTLKYFQRIKGANRATTR